MKKPLGIKITILFILFLNFICSLVIVIGLRGDVISPFRDFRAISNTEKYFVDDTLIVEDIKVYSGSGKKSNNYTTIISGEILNTGIKNNITFLYDDDFYRKLILKKKYKGKDVNALKVIRNNISGCILIKNARLLQYKRREAIIEIYCLSSLFPSLIIFILLIKKK